jgi:hypothetical protein
METIFANSIYTFELEYSETINENGLIKFGPPTNENNKKLTFLAYGPTFEIMSSALEEATYINHITGAPFVVTSILYNKIFQKAIVIINIENEKSIDVKTTNISDLNYNFVKMIAKHWLKNTI